MQIENRVTTVLIQYLVVQHRKNFLISGEKSGFPGFFFFFNRSFSSFH